MTRYVSLLTSFVLAVIAQAANAFAFQTPQSTKVPSIFQLSAHASSRRSLLESATSTALAIAFSSVGLTLPKEAIAAPPIAIIAEE